MDIEDIAEEHSIKDLGRVSLAYQCGFTQGANYQKQKDIEKACKWLENKGSQLTYWCDILDNFKQAMEE